MKRCYLRLPQTRIFFFFPPHISDKCACGCNPKKQGKLVVFFYLRGFLLKTEVVVLIDNDIRNGYSFFSIEFLGYICFVLSPIGVGDTGDFYAAVKFFQNSSRSKSGPFYL